MSIFTTLPRENYDDRAFAGFDPAAEGFVLANALAMAWAAQLAYETETPDKMRDVAAAWGFGALEPLIVQLNAVGILRVTDTRGFVAAGDQATIVGFSGTDPPVLANWVTNGRPSRSIRAHSSTSFLGKFGITFPIGTSPPVRPTLGDRGALHRPA